MSNSSPQDLIISMDTSEWPLLNLKPVRAGTDEEMAEFITCFEAESRERQQPFTIILDLRNKIKMSKEQRAMISAMSKGPDVAPYLKGEAMIVGSGFGKWLFTVILFLGKPHIPIKPFSDIAKAKTWARQLLN